MHSSLFEYLKPTDSQLADMSKARAAFAVLYNELDALLPVGSDAEHVFRTIRDAAMWANVAITREPDGSPRKD